QVLGVRRHHRPPAVAHGAGGLGDGGLPADHRAGAFGVRVRAPARTGLSRCRPDRRRRMTAALLGFLGVFAMAFLRVPLAVAMATAGFVGMGLLRGWQPALASASQVIFETGFAYVLSVIPLFVLMGNFVARAGMARE